MPDHGVVLTGELDDAVVSRDVGLTDAAPSSMLVGLVVFFDRGAAYVRHSGGVSHVLVGTVGS
jgi:hypothetical protein